MSDRAQEKEYVGATTTIARILIKISREDAEDNFDEVLEDYTGDFIEQLKEEIHTQLKEDE